MHAVLTGPLLVLTLVVPAAPSGRVSDYAGLLAPAARARLEARLAEREGATGVQMAIAIFAGLEGESLEDFSIRLAQRWRIGRKGLDDGAILLVFVRERKTRLEVGYGLETRLPDSVAAAILRETLAPHFRAQRYAAGLEAAVDAVYTRVAPGPGAAERFRSEEALWRERQREAERVGRFNTVFFVGLAGMMMLGFALAARRRRGYAARGRGWRSSGWTDGWSAGASGGGSGGNGFSGGGGDFGGGGASGDW